MDYKLLKDHTENALKSIQLPVLKKDGINAVDFFGVDVRQRKWMMNHGGYSRSELAMIFEQENLQAQANLLAQMQDYTPDSNPTSGLTDVEISMMHKSKYQQTPNEMQTWLDGLLQIRDAKRQQAYEKMHKAATARANNKASENSVNVEPE